MYERWTPPWTRCCSYVTCTKVKCILFVGILYGLFQSGVPSVYRQSEETERGHRLSGNTIFEFLMLEGGTPTYSVVVTSQRDVIAYSSEIWPMRCSTYANFPCCWRWWLWMRDSHFTSNWPPKTWNLSMTRWWNSSKGWSSISKNRESYRYLLATNYVQTFKLYCTL